MRFLTSCVLAASSLALGCGARSDVDRVDWGHDAHGALDGSGIEAGDAGASDDGDAGDGDAASCPRGRSASPLLVAHLGLRPTVRRGAQTADELVTAVSTTVDGVGSYRVVAVSKCGAVREILAGEPHAPAPNYTSLTIQGDTLFMANSGGVFSAPASGGVPHLVAAAPGLGVFAVDDAFVYVSTSDHHVVRTPRDGGPLVDIASHGGLDIAVDDTFIYVVDEQRRLLRITKADTTQVTVLAEAVSGNSGYWWDTGWLAQDATRVFFASPSPGTRVCAIPKTGGAPSCTAPLAASSLVWSGALYFATTSGTLAAADEVAADDDVQHTKARGAETGDDEPVPVVARRPGEADAVPDGADQGENDAAGDGKRSQDHERDAALEGSGPDRPHIENGLATAPGDDEGHRGLHARTPDAIPGVRRQGRAARGMAHVAPRSAVPLLEHEVRGAIDVHRGRRQS